MIEIIKEAASNWIKDKGNGKFPIIETLIETIENKQIRIENSKLVSKIWELEK